jgi:hypothetical protein
MRIPISYVVFRSLVAALVFLTLLLAGLGLAGHGPFGGAAQVGTHALHWLSEYTGVPL